VRTYLFLYRTRINPLQDKIKGNNIKKVNNAKENKIENKKKHCVRLIMNTN